MLLRFRRPPRPEIYTLSLHDALPIFGQIAGTVRHVGHFGARVTRQGEAEEDADQHGEDDQDPGPPAALFLVGLRSEEHTSELQSHVNLVCRLLLEKKKKKRTSRQ